MSRLLDVFMKRVNVIVGGSLWKLTGPKVASQHSLQAVENDMSVRFDSLIEQFNQFLVPHTDISMSESAKDTRENLLPAHQFEPFFSALKNLIVVFCEVWTALGRDMDDGARVAIPAASEATTVIVIPADFNRDLCCSLAKASRQCSDNLDSMFSQEQKVPLLSWLHSSTRQLVETVQTLLGGAAGPLGQVLVDFQNSCVQSLLLEVSTASQVALRPHVGVDAEAVAQSLALLTRTAEHQRLDLFLTHARSLALVAGDRPSMADSVDPTARVSDFKSEFASAVLAAVEMRPDSCAAAWEHVVQKQQVALESLKEIKRPDLGAIAEQALHDNALDTVVTAVGLRLHGVISTPFVDALTLQFTTLVTLIPPEYLAHAKSGVAKVVCGTSFKPKVVALSPVINALNKLHNRVKLQTLQLEFCGTDTIS